MINQRSASARCKVRPNRPCLAAVLWYCPKRAHLRERHQRPLGPQHRTGAAREPPTAAPRVYVHGQCACANAVCHASSAKPNFDDLAYQTGACVGGVGMRQNQHFVIHMRLRQVRANVVQTAYPRRRSAAYRTTMNRRRLVSRSLDDESLGIA